MVSPREKKIPTQGHIVKGQGQNVVLITYWYLLELYLIWQKIKLIQKDNFY